MVSESAFTVQAHGVHTAFVENVSSLKKRRDTKVYVNAERPNVDVTHIQTVGPYSLKKIRAARGAIVISAHVTPDSFVGSLIGARLWYGLARAYLRWFYNHADVVFAVSGEVKGELLKMRVTSQIVVMPNTIDTSRFAKERKRRAYWRKRFQIDPKTFVVIGVGQIQPRKRIDTFVKTAKALPKMRFEWVGGIPFKRLAASYEQMQKVIEHHPDNVVFSGIIPLEQVHGSYAAADAFFLPSSQETFGIVIVEAAASGLPVVMRDIKQYRQTFGDTYLKGEDKDFPAIFRRLARDKQFYARWQEKAAEIAHKYDSAAGAVELVKAYKLAMRLHREKAPR